jgi:hypothetical protein
MKRARTGLRRPLVLISALGVAMPGLVFGAAPAGAAISGAGITPSVWSPGAQDQAVLTWNENASTSNNNAFNNSNPSAGGNFISVEVGWGWALANANPTSTPVSYAAVWDNTAKAFTCTTVGTVFSSPAFTNTNPDDANVTSGALCLVRRSSTFSGNPGQQVVLANIGLGKHFGFNGSGSPAISVTFPAGKITAPSSGPASDTWRIISLTESNTTTVSTTVPAVDSAGNPIPLITINIDANGGSCITALVTGYQGTWATAPPAGNCARAGAELAGFNTSADGSGLAIAPGGNLQLTGDNTLYAQYVTPRVAGAPTDVVATGGYKNVKVSWQAPSDPGTSSIGAYLVQTDTGRACITRVASENPLECTYSELTPGTKYTFRVQALNQVGWGAFSAASNAASPYDLKLDVLSRPEVKFLFFKRGSNLEAEGRAPGLAAGTVLTPVMQIGTDGAFVPLAKDTTKVNGDGAFSWSRKLDKKDNGKPVSLYFSYGDAKTSTLTAKLGATVGLPSAPRDVKVTSGASGFTVSWKPPARDGGSPIAEYVMTSDVRAPSWAQSKFVSCTVKAPVTNCTMPGSTTVFDPNKTYTFSVVAKTERGTSPQATKKWKGQVYRLNIFKRARIDSEVLLSFSAFGWAKDARGFEIQAKVGENGTWNKQGTASLDPDYVGLGDWAGMLPKSVAGGSEVFYRIKSDKGYSNVVRFRLSSSFEYSFG